MIVKIKGEPCLHLSIKLKMLDARSQEKVKISSLALKVMKSVDQQQIGFN